MNTPTPSFRALGVPDEIAAVLERSGIATPFDIQAAAIPDALAGRDVLARAPTGSGKTLAFGLPLVAQVGKGTSRRPRALILSPTRELAEQIRRELEPLAAAKGRNVLAVYGGVGMNPQRSALQRGVDILVACPGRLTDLIEQGCVNLGDVDQVVIDEADRMADMGFLPTVRKLLDMTAQRRQTQLYSATLDNDVKVLVDRYQHKPARHEVGEKEPDLSNVSHRFIAADRPEKLALSADLIEDAGPTIVFCRTRHGADRVAKQLKRVGIKAAPIHGGRSQGQRTRALEAFADGKVTALVATDVAARGIHVDGVQCVLHFDLPPDPKDYVHRSGRTARAGADGQVVSLVQPDQRKDLRKLQRDVGLPQAESEQAFVPTVRAQVPVHEPKSNNQRRNPRSGGGGGGGGGGRSNAGGRSAGGGRSGGRSGQARSGGGSRSGQR